MALKTDYKDALFETGRKYQITKNEDETYTILDVTEYMQEGDLFGAGDINATNAAVNAHISAKNNPHGVTAAQVGARPNTWTPTASDVGAIPQTTVYYNAASAMSADDLTVPLALIPISSTVNAELFSILNGSNAYVLTIFYGSVATTSRRMQIAFTYNYTITKMAMRLYGANGWVAWKEVANADEFLPLTGGGLIGELSVSNRVAHILGYDDTTTRFAQFGVLYANGQRSHMLNLDIFGNVLINCYDESGTWKHDKMVYHTDNITAGTTDLTAGTSILTTGHIYEQYE